MNRGVGRMGLFADRTDYECFLEVLGNTQAKIPMRVCGYCVMPNHWHLALWPEVDGVIPRFVQHLTTEHVRRWRRRWDVSGHIYQSRYRSFVVSTDNYYLKLLRYIERNPVRAGLVESPERWLWSSVRHRLDPHHRSPVRLDDGPIRLPHSWQSFINSETAEDDQKKLSRSFARGAPFGDDAWVESVATKLGVAQHLEPTRGRQSEGQ